MPWGLAAAAIPAVIGAASGAAQGGAVSSGVGAANAISQKTIDEAGNIYQPYIDQGKNALLQEGNILGVNGQDAANTAMANFTASPGYGYQVQQGLRAVDAGAAASGMLRSGATLKAEQTLGSNLANQDFGNYINRLSGLATTGLQGTGNFTNILSGQSSGQQGTITSGAGNQASIYGNTAAGLGSAAQSYIKNQLYGDGGTIGSPGGFGGGSPFDAAGVGI